MHPSNKSGIATGTSVFTREGDKLVESIRPGDEVLSFPYDEVPPERMREKSEMTFSPVVSISSWECDEIIELEVLCFAAGVKETLKVSASQLVYVEKRGWVPARDIGRTTVLMNSAFGNNMCTIVTSRRQATTVYFLGLERDHSFYIGKSDTWVSAFA